MTRVMYEQWGKPDGIAGRIPSLDYEEAAEQARKVLFYKVQIDTKGIYFELLKEPQHTDDDVSRAKEWLAINRDAGSIKVVEELAQFS